MTLTIPPPLQPLLERLRQEALTPVLVGGFVRDSILNIPSKDIDIEVYGIDDITLLQSYLKSFGRVYEVGSSFGVLKLSIADWSLDIALPRTESKVGKGHKGFNVTTYRSLSFKEAALRRDFTMNAMGYDVTENSFLDPYSGLEDLQSGMLREVNASTFVEDPLRVYRGVQFCARYELSCADSLITLCQKMVSQDLLSELPKERVFEEFKKLLLKAKKPSIGMRLMEQFGIFRYFSELEHMSAMRCHSQNDIFNHTVLTLDMMASMRSGDEKYDLVMMLSVLCHKMPQNGITFLARLTDETKLIEHVSTLVAHNRLPQKMFDAKASDYEILHLATKVTLSELIHLAKAIDLKCHRNTTGHTFEAGAWLTQKAKDLHVFSSPLKPLLQGRDLIAAGLDPSPLFKTILETAYDAQLHQEFTCKEEGLIWLKAYISK